MALNEAASHVFASKFGMPVLPGLDLTSTSFADLGVRVSLDLEEALGGVESIEKQSVFPA